LDFNKEKIVRNNLPDLPHDQKKKTSAKKKPTRKSLGDKKIVDEYPNTETATLVIGNHTTSQTTEKSNTQSSSEISNISTAETKTQQRTGSNTESKSESTTTDPLRKILEEKSKKYSHLPVYNREEEAMKEKQRHAAMSTIMTDVGRQLGAVTNLTSSHMADKGVNMVPSPTPFDDPPPIEEKLTKQSYPQSQGSEQKCETEEVNNELINNSEKQTKFTQEESEVTVTSSELTAVTTTETTTNLGVQESIVKLEIETKDIEDDLEIPFVDGPGESDDYTKVPRASNVRGNLQRSRSWQYMRLTKKLSQK